MKVECILKTEYSSLAEEMKVESTLDWPQKTVKLIIDDREIVVDSDELIKAVQNCVNC